MCISHLITLRLLAEVLLVIQASKGPVSREEMGGGDV